MAKNKPTKSDVLPCPSFEDAREQGLTDPVLGRQRCPRGGGVVSHCDDHPCGQLRAWVCFPLGMRRRSVEAVADGLAHIFSLGHVLQVGRFIVSFVMVAVVDYVAGWLFADESCSYQRVDMTCPANTVRVKDPDSVVSVPPRAWFEDVLCDCAFRRLGRADAPLRGRLVSLSGVWDHFPGFHAVGGYPSCPA